MKKAVNVVIYKNKEVLILKRSDEETHFQGLWDLPGGVIKGAESFKQAAEREVKEETGLKVKLDDSHFFVFQYDRTPEGEVLGFMAELVSGEVTLSKEHVKFKWVTKENYKGLDYVPSVNAVIRAFFDKR